ncbi:MAG: hypothetical protein Q8M29_09145 [Bacteroidota bacterium]|nr:hypothetical protein [Bacteroidota bacterium]
MKIKNLLKIISILAICITYSSCKKEPGEGGRATIKGRVKIKSYNKEFTILKDEYYSQGENVYITYGDNPAVQENTKTSYDGTFEFPYLRKGKYKVFVVSKDSTSPDLTATISIIKEVEITAKKQTVQIPEITVID